MKQLKDYLHLYLGCECQLFWRNEDGTVENERNGVLEVIRPETEDQYGLGFKCPTKGGNFIQYNYPYSDVKPILRPLSDMTEEEEKEAYTIKGGNSFKEFFEGETTRYLLSKHFDLFGLIDTGLAIDKTKLDHR